MLLILLSSNWLQSQEKALEPPVTGLHGSPNIVHYNREDFDSDPQFWTVAESPNGVLYFGNNDGALIFDGEQWHKVYLPNRSSIRSLVADSLGNIYAGGFDEFGMIKQNDRGQYYFESLLDTLNFSDPSIANLWQVHVSKGHIIYRSFNQLIVIKDNRFTTLPATTYFIKSFQIGQEYFVQDEREGIFRLDLENMNLEKFLEKDQVLREEVIAMLPMEKNGMMMAVTKTGKVFEINRSEKSAKLINKLFQNEGIDQVESAIRLKSGNYYLGTLANGIIILDKFGNVIENGLHHQELQDYSVLNLFETKSGNIWALLNNGLDFIALSSPVTTIFEGASLYDALIRESEIYLATNQGVFFSDKPDQGRLGFKKVQGLEGQAWTLQLYKGDVLVGHNKGLFKIDGSKIAQIGKMNGIWKVIPLKGKPDLFLAASYSGLFVLEKTDGGAWKVLRKIEGFEESSRDIMETDKPGTFWICHGYKGVFRVRLDPDYTKMASFEHFTTQNGLSHPYNVNVFEWEGETIFTSNTGIYSYNNDHSAFEPHARLNNILDPTVNTRTLFQHQDKTWFVQGDEAGYFQTDALEPKLEKGYFLQFKGAFNRGMECIVPINNEKVMVGTKKGLYLLDLTYDNQKKVANTLLTGARYAYEDGEEDWLPLENGDQLKLRNRTNSLQFAFSVPDMPKGIDIQYAYKLENADKNWSEWQFDPHKEYSHLRPGSYEFKVRSRSLLGIPGREASIRFEILPLWYQTTLAVILYILSGIMILILVVKFVKRKIDRENEKSLEATQKEKKLLELELTQLRLKAEKEKISKDKLELEENVIHKSKELANYTMLLVKKKEVFSEILEDVKEVRKLVRNEGSRRKLQKIFSKLNKHAIGEEYINVFETNFEKVHHYFFQNLRQQFPNLSQRELRLCAFIKMNLSNKEISPLLNISVRGVETARYRVRKKMNLEHEENLTAFLEAVESTERIGV